MAAVEEYSTRPVKRVSAADRPRLEEIKEWGQSTEIQLVEMAITDHTLGITEFEAIKVEVEQIVPTDRRELFSWKFFGHILNAPLDSDTFQYPPVGRERSPADRIKQNWFRRTNSTVRITAAKVLTPGSIGFSPLVDKGWRLDERIEFPGDGHVSAPVRSGHYISIWNWMLADPLIERAGCSSYLGIIAQDRATPLRGIDLFAEVSAKVFSILPLHKIPS